MAAGKNKTRRKSNKTIIRAAARQASRKYRENIKSNPAKYEEYKEKDKERKKKAKLEKAKLEGNVSSTNQLSKREERQRRIRNRDYVRKFRLKQKQMEEKSNEESNIDDLETIITSDSTACSTTKQSNQGATVTAGPSGNDGLCQTSMPINRQRLAGRRQIRKDRSQLNRENEKLRKQTAELQRSLWRLQKKNVRRRRLVGSSGPREKLQQLTSGRFLQPDVEEELFKGLVVQEELEHSKETVGSHTKASEVFSRVISGRVMKKYKVLHKFKSILPTRSSRKGRDWETKDYTANDVLNVTQNPNSLDVEKKNAIIKFFDSDVGSHLTPGKKDYILVDGVKVQKRYLNDTMSALFPIFLSSSSVVVSFSTFCKHRPKYVVEPKLSGRDTCLCVKCENFKLVITCLRSAKCIEQKNRHEVMSTLCCDINNENCMFRICDKCKTNTINYNINNGNDEVVCQKWVTKNEENKNKPNTFMKITAKIDETCTINDCVAMFEVQLKLYMEHRGRIIHQRAAWAKLKEKMSDKDLLLIVDWSENYQCKLNEEVQSMHFGGSHSEISLHTGMAMSKGLSESFCTVGDHNKHGPPFIYAHLKPILLKYATEKTENLHILSDGPTTQSRSCSMFNIVATLISKLLPNLKTITWNFSEAGHGKSEADGTGGTVKRTADSAVAFGHDIRDLNDFVKIVQNRCPNVFICLIPHTEIEAALGIELPKLQPFKGTMKVHQYFWFMAIPSEIHFKSLSCYECNIPVSSSDLCEHFTMGLPWSIQAKQLSKEKPQKLAVATQQSADKSVISVKATKKSKEKSVKNSQKGLAELPKIDKDKIGVPLRRSERRKFV